MKLHLGSGAKYLPDFIHIDISEYPHIDYVAPIFPLPQFKESSVSEIYVSHALEYFDFSEAVSVLGEWKRLLKPGGKLRVSVPDFDKLLMVYNKSNCNIDKIIGPIFGRWKVGDSYIYHKTVYNQRKLTELMCQVGFNQIIQWDPLEYFGDNEDSYDDYSKAYFPHMDFKNGFPISINIVAIND